MLIMSNLTKAQATHQSAWYTCRASLGANGIPDKLIKGDLQQPHRIKIAFEEGSKDIKISLKSYNPNQLDFRHKSLLKCHMLSTQHGHLDITRHVETDQAQFEPKYFLALTEYGPTLFNLIGQCFQDVGLTKWNKVAGKQCPDNTNLAKASFKE
jgi:hypothetical protein